MFSRDLNREQGQDGQPEILPEPLSLRTHKQKTNPALARKIHTLRLSLHPLVPLPNGDPHPAFPRTLLAYHLLTEEELDSIAHYYHQSTPNEWTHQYPACMNWDKEWLDGNRVSRRGSRLRRRSSIVGLGQDSVPATPGLSITTTSPSTLTASDTHISPTNPHHSRRPSTVAGQEPKEGAMDESPDWWTQFLPPSLASTSSSTGLRRSSSTPPPTTTNVSPEAKNYKNLSREERIAIKRRKVGKFIGLIGMETPESEIEGRMVAAMERVIAAGREELRDVEEWYLRRRKIG